MTTTEFAAYAKARKITPANQVRLLTTYITTRMYVPKLPLKQFLDQVDALSKLGEIVEPDALLSFCKKAPTETSFGLTGRDWKNASTQLGWLFDYVDVLAEIAAEDPTAPDLPFLVYLRDFTQAGDRPAPEQLTLPGTELPPTPPTTAAATGTTPAATPTPGATPAPAPLPPSDPGTLHLGCRVQLRVGSRDYRGQLVAMHTAGDYGSVLTDAGELMQDMALRAIARISDAEPVTFAEFARKPLMLTAAAVEELQRILASPGDPAIPDGDALIGYNVPFDDGCTAVLQIANAKQPYVDWYMLDPESRIMAEPFDVEPTPTRYQLLGEYYLDVRLTQRRYVMELLVQ